MKQRRRRHTAASTRTWRDIIIRKVFKVRKIWQVRYVRKVRMVRKARKVIWVRIVRKVRIIMNVRNVRKVKKLFSVVTASSGGSQSGKNGLVRYSAKVRDCIAPEQWVLQHGGSSCVLVTYTGPQDDALDPESDEGQKGTEGVVDAGQKG